MSSFGLNDKRGTRATSPVPVSSAIPDKPARRLFGATLIRAVYLGLFSLGGKLLGRQQDPATLAYSMRLAVDEALSPGANPEMTVDVTKVGALGPTAVGLVITIPVLLLSSLFQVDAVVTAILAYMMTCTALAATQTARYLAAVRDRSRWQKAGRPQDWKASALARPSGIDIIVWLVLAAFLICATK